MFRRATASQPQPGSQVRSASKYNDRPAREWQPSSVSGVSSDVITIALKWRAGLSQRGEHLDSVFLRHPDVDQGEIEFALFELLQSVGPIGRGYDGKFFGAQEFRNQEPVVRSSSATRMRVIISSFR